MHQLKTTVLMLCAALLLASCEKTRLPENDTDTIAGTWNWQRTDGGIAAHIHETPQSSGVQKKVDFTADGRYRWFTNNVESAQGTYTLQQQACIHDGKQKSWIRFSAHPEQNRLVEVLESNVLLLSDEAHDGLQYQYTRIPNK
ncbi:hypothetical protein [Pseudocnuella soli]|uniref:hypothetical protein n=1 Tax=Pseudocnuella soli TaxID=2502779 RepID=UPI0010479D19|nr:hypothetical protein [Pseudocnuella soli]